MLFAFMHGIKLSILVQTAKIRFLFFVGDLEEIQSGGQDAVFSSTTFGFPKR